MPPVCLDGCHPKGPLPLSTQGLPGSPRFSSGERRQLALPAEDSRDQQKGLSWVCVVGEAQGNLRLFLKNSIK